MEIIVKHIESKYPSFNIGLASKEGAEPFLEIKGCRLVEGSKGQFVSGPATKNQSTGKYWQHTYFSEKFSAAVLAKVLETMPKKASGKTSGGMSQDDSDDIPF